MLQVQTGGFWKFCLIYGAGLLVLAGVARRFLAAEPLAKNTYLTQGLLLVTVGFITKYSGLQLALILATESVILLMAGQQRKNMVLRVGAYIAAGLAVGWGMDGMRQFDTHGPLAGLGLGALMLVNMVLVHRETAASSQAAMRPQPSYFAVLALLIGLVAVWDNTTRANFPLVLAVARVPLTFSIYLLRVPRIHLAQPGLPGAGPGGLGWLTCLTPGRLPPWWNPVLMIVISLGLSHWWQGRRSLSCAHRSDWSGKGSMRWRLSACSTAGWRQRPACRPGWR